MRLWPPIYPNGIRLLNSLYWGSLLTFIPCLSFLWLGTTTSTSLNCSCHLPQLRSSSLRLGPLGWCLLVMLPLWSSLLQWLALPPMVGIASNGWHCLQWLALPPMVSNAVGDLREVWCFPLMVVSSPSCITDMGLNNQKVTRVQQVHK